VEIQVYLEALAVVEALDHRDRKDQRELVDQQETLGLLEQPVSLAFLE